MIIVTSIVGTASEPPLADHLHRLEHKDSVEHLVIDRDDIMRRRLRGKTDKGTDIVVALERTERLVDGAVLLLDEAWAVVLQVTQERWLRIKLRDANSALEAGYCAGNHHWRVRFEPGALLVAMQGPAEHYLASLEPLLRRGGIEVADDE